MAHSEEEEVARDFICSGKADATVVVCDATCLERNLNLVLQILDLTSQVIVCVNLCDEAAKKGIQIDFDKLSQLLSVPVVPASAAKGRGMSELTAAIAHMTENEKPLHAYELTVPITGPMADTTTGAKFENTKCHFACESCAGAGCPYKLGKNENPSSEKFSDSVEQVSATVKRAEQIASQVVTHTNPHRRQRDQRIDRIVTSPVTGVPIMLLTLAIVFWLTITGANYPSALLADGLFWIQDRLMDFAVALGAPSWLTGSLILGMYRVLAWVVSVMLPPMAIFFPLFTLLEDLGYLPRIAFNLDRGFKKCCACGKQGLTMCMGFGCNAAGVIGCRIIDSPRERLIAILTNSLVPCNGRFPTLLMLITIFFVGSSQSGILGSMTAALMLTGVILMGVAATFLVSKLLSKTVLKGMPSSFTLELPPYRQPQIGKVILRSIYDRTLFVLGRAIVVAAPAGLVIWLMANIQFGGSTLLALCSQTLDPFARLMGLDGVILLAFILGFPANEIVIPIVLMAYLQTGTILEMDNLLQVKELFLAHGWTWATAVSTILFSLFHWPCSTTCLTIKKETGSLKWTAAAFLLPTLLGIVICMLFTMAVRMFGLA